MQISLNSNVVVSADVARETLAPDQPPQDRSALVRAVNSVNSAGLFGGDHELTFILDRASRRAVVRIVNRETHEVIQQIPDEYVLRMAEELSRT